MEQSNHQTGESVFLPREHNMAWSNALRGEWVQEVEVPTTEIDWERMRPFCEWETTRASDRIYRGEQAHREMVQKKLERLRGREQAKLPGFACRDAALNEAFSKSIPSARFMGPGNARTPQQRGAPIHTGTPVENAEMMMAALHFMGAVSVGFLELRDETTRKLVYRQESDKGKTTVFEETDIGYETENLLVVPKNAKWVIVYAIQMSHNGLAQAPSLLSRATTMQAYSRLYTIYNQLHEFIRGLGYHSYGSNCYNGFGPAPAFAVLAGLGELSRMDCLITPEYGPMVRLAAMATDLPLACTRPISFGVREYCRVCKVCAASCPVKSISFDDEPSWEVRGPWSSPGHKAYFRDALKCRDYFYLSGSNCGVCFTRCPFSEPDPEKYLHFVSHLGEEVAGVRKMTGALKPGRDPVSWWDRPSSRDDGAR